MTKRRFALELAAIYCLLALLGGIFNGGNWAFVGVSLHPYLAVVAVEAVQYGLLQSMLAAGTGCLLYGLCLKTTAAAGPGNHLAILFGILATGLLLGLTQESRNKKLRALLAQLEEAKKDQERLRQRVSVLSAANDELNERILGEVTTVQSFSEIARRLSVLDEQDLYPAICELVRDYLQADEASYYALEGDYLVMKAQQGWSCVPEEASKIPRGDDLLWAALQSGHPVTPVDRGASPLESPGDPSRRHTRLICAPVLHPRTHQPIGVLSVDRLPFSKFHGSSIKVLGVIARWAGDSLHNASLFEQLRSEAGNA
jgi:hypothetical protein